MKEKRELFHLTWPIFLESVLFSLMGSMDVMMLSKYSDYAVGAVGVVNQILFMFRVVAGVVTTGIGILCAQYIGANKKRKQIDQLIALAFCLNGAIGATVSLAVVLFHKAILNGMHMDPLMYPYGKQYLIIVGSGFVIQLIIMTTTVVMRAYGNTRQGMYFSLLMNGCNLCLNYILIYGKFGIPRLGAAGAALGTVISNAIGLVLVLRFLLKKVLPGFSFLGHFKGGFRVIKEILYYGSPAAGEQISYTLAKLIVMSFVTTLGVTAVSAYSYVNTIVGFVYLFSGAVGSGTAILIGWKVGERDFDLVQKLGGYSVKLSFVVSMVATGILVLIRYPVLSLFTENPEILALGASVIMTDFLLEAGRSCNLVYVSGLRAAGDVRFPMYIGLFSMWAIGVGVCYILGIKMGLGLIGIWIGLGLDECFRAVGMGIRFRRGTWRKLLEEEEK